MVDIRLITILPPQAVQGVPQGKITQNATSQTPGILSSLPVGSVLSGFIVNRDATGNPVLRTENGDVVFETSFFLKIGSEVVIRIAGGNVNPRAVITSVNGQPPEIAENASAFNSTQDVVVSGNSRTSQANPQQFTQSSVTIQPPAEPDQLPVIRLTATLVTPASPAPDESPLPTLPTGSRLNLAITTVSQPVSVPSAQPSNPSAAPSTGYVRFTLPQAPVQTTSPVSSNTQTPVVQTTSAPLPNTAVSAPVTFSAPINTAPVTPPSTSVPSVAAPAPSANPAAPSTINQAPVAGFNPNVPPALPSDTPIIPKGYTASATIIATEPTGEPLAQTPFGLIRLPQGISFPTGTSLQFQVVSTTPPEEALLTLPAVTPSVGTSVPLSELATHWTSLAQIFAVLEQLGNQKGQPFIHSGLPWISPQTNTAQQPVSSGVLFFLSALGGNDFKSWLGEKNIRLLEEKGYGDLVKRAEGDFASIARQYAVPSTSQHWQALFFPIAVAGDLQQARLFVKRDRKGSGQEDNRNNDEDTRFVLEVSMSQLGEMQMDGFVRRKDRQVQFDLVIRSIHELTLEAQNDIISIYNSAGELTGFQGTLMFQAVREFPVKPMEDILQQSDHGFVA